MDRSDGRLAPVSYIFGAQAPSEPDPDEIAPDEVAPREHTAHEVAPHEGTPHNGTAAGDTATPAANGRTTSSGWYLEPGAVEEAAYADEGAAEPGAGEPEPEPEAASIAAARRFLALVESGGVGVAGGGAVGVGAAGGDPVGRADSARSGVRFTEQPESEQPEAEQTEAEQTEAELPEPATPERPPVRKASINALARKGMSSAEMTTLLENREIEPDEVAAEVERLEGAGLLDDRILAEDLVRTLRDRKGLGKSAITAELRRRRVDQAAIDEALDSVDVDDELERATEVAIKRAGQLSSYDRTTAERRLSAFLQRRGYSGTVVGAAVKAALGPAGPRFR